MGPVKSVLADCTTTAIASETLRLKLLERKIDAIKDAIGRARTTWLFATLITFIFATAIYNTIFSYNYGQLMRRSMLLGFVSQDRDTFNKMLANQEGEEFVRSTLHDGKGDLGYLHELVPTPTRKFDKLDELQNAIRYELQQRIARAVVFDSFTIPLIGVSVAASDLGIVGGLALAIIGFWFLVTLRRENHAFGEFIRQPFGKVAFKTDHSGSTDIESTYAYQSISQYTLFGVSSKTSPINYVTFAGFLVPPILLCVNHLATAIEIGQKRGLGDYFQPRIVLELILVILVVVIWTRSLGYELNTVHALQAWKESSDDVEARLSPETAKEKATAVIGEISLG
jgi:hypothetical protein